jgi:lactoylglutathione lyase
MPARKTAKKAKKVKKKIAQVSRQEPESLRLRTAMPSLTVDDIEASLAWYGDVLGFTLKERWMHDGKLMGAEIVAGTVTFYLGQDDWKKGRDRVKGEGFRVYCETAQDVDALAAQVKARGGRILEEPHDEPWGARAFAVQDLDGFKITISKS